MSPQAHEWLHLLLRWFHIMAGIMWIGDSFYFMWLDSHLTVPDPPRERVDGELWMTHSGFFYRVEKRRIGPGMMPPKLYWFWSEATLTWVSGFFLLGVVYYMSGPSMLLGSTSHVSAGTAMAVGLGSLVVGWLVYDAVWMSPVGKVPALGSVVCFALLVGAAYELAHVLSGRAAFMHVGAMLGTIMVCNVWFKILPAQRAMVAATNEGREPDHERGKKAKLRSIHNNYMTLPVIFVMLSNHFPTLYGHSENWLILMLLFLAAGCIRYWMNKRTVPSRWGLVAGAAVLAGVMLMSAPPSAPTSDTPVAELTQAPPTTPAGPGLHGVAHLDGVAPAPATITMPPGCEMNGKSQIADDKVLVRDGLVQNVFVWISKGAEGVKSGPPPAPLKVDQTGCMYTHHVFGVQVGQKVTFVNNDSQPHNVRVETSHGDLFNTMLPSQGDTFTQVFTTPEQMLHARCDIHPWMSAYIGVVSNPFFAVTDERGQYLIPNLPAGHYTVSAWHEVFGRTSQDVTIGPDGTGTADFHFTPKP